MISLASPAKINLFLRILRRRSDGYHELASLFQTISLCDRLHVSLSEVDELHCSDASVPTCRKNLIWKAVDLYRQKSGNRFCVKIDLEKNIPMQAGLGGGSSNAATALWAVNSLAKTPVSMSELQAWSAEVGSDVPFFFSSGTAYCTGRGEQVQTLPSLAPQEVWIFKPKGGLPTPAVYQQLKVEDLIPRDPIACLDEFLAGKESYFNDLEAPAIQLMPSLTGFKAALSSLGFQHVLMSGSGTAFFCIGERKKSMPQEFKDFHQSACFINRRLIEWY